MGKKGGAGEWPNENPVSTQCKQYVRGSKNYTPPKWQQAVRMPRVKIKADLTAHRGLNHQTPETIETKLPCSCKCKGCKPKSNPEPINPRKRKGIEWQ